MNLIYSSLDKSILLSSLEENNSIVYGYDMRTEEFLAIPKDNLIAESISTVFKYINHVEKELIGRIAGLLQIHGFSLDDIANNANLSKRTIHRYINLNNS